MNALKVYIASSWRNQDRVNALAEKLRLIGYDCNPFTVEHSDCNSEVVIEKGVEKDFPKLEEHFEWCWHEAATSDVLILMLPCGNDAHIEFGMARQAGRECLILGPVERPGLMYHGCKVFDTEEALLDYLANGTIRISIPDDGQEFALGQLMVAVREALATWLNSQEWDYLQNEIEAILDQKIPDSRLNSGLIMSRVRKTVFGQSFTLADQLQVELQRAVRNLYFANCICGGKCN